MIFRSIVFALLALLAVFTTPLLSLPAAILYAVRWFAPELILLGALIDGYFGPDYTWPYYTLVAFLMVVTAEIGKRFLMLK